MQSPAAPMTYQPALDGLRAIAAVAVVGRHSGGLVGGFLGVDLFFVLSGYLITRSLAERPELVGFYVGRLRRLVPALTLMLIGYLLVFPWLVPDHPHVRDTALAYFYLSDYGFAFWGVPVFLQHTWTLSVEEHFYLLWPLLFLRVRPSVGFLMALYAIATAWRWVQPDWYEAYYRFDTRASGLLLGCLLAHLPRLRLPAWPALVLLVLAFVFLDRNGPYTQGIGLSLVELVAAWAIVGAHPAWLGWAPLAYLGKLSYGIYLWHYPIARVLRDADEPWQVVAGVTVVASIVLAAISYHTVEAAFRHRAPAREAEPA